MMLTKQSTLMAGYNQWMNAQLFSAVSTLSAEKINEPSGAFFGSIFGTLNHIIVADTAWLKRFAQHSQPFLSLANVTDLPMPARLDKMLFHDFEKLTTARRLLDDTII